MVGLLLREYQFLNEYSEYSDALLTGHWTTCPDDEKMIYQILMRNPMGSRDISSLAKLRAYMLIIQGISNDMEMVYGPIRGWEPAVVD